MNVNFRECEYCGDEYRGKAGLRIHQTTAHEDEVTTTVGCHWCGSDVEVREWETEERHYCSKVCGKAWKAFLTKGENHPNYKDGQSRGFVYNRLAFAVRRRDGNACRRCGSESGGSDGRSLHVHHVVPQEDAESPHQPENLITLCPACHKDLEGMEPEEQLESCGIDSLSELDLPPDLKEWYNSLRRKRQTLDGAPVPRPGMFEAAQQYWEADPDE